MTSTPPKPKHRWAPTVLFLAVSLLTASLVHYQPPKRVLLVDRPRHAQADDDFVIRFLQVTSTDYRVDEGFVSLAGHRANQQRLLQLLSALQRCMEVAEQNERRVGRSRCCLPTADGSVEVLEAAAGQHLESLEQLRREYQAVRAALTSIAPNWITVGSPSQLTETNVAAAKPARFPSLEPATPTRLSPISRDPQEPPMLPALRPVSANTPVQP